MWIEKVRLRNYRQHVDRTIDFSPYMNLILGPIGSGKSNILEAMYWGLTNKSRSGARGNDISQFAASHEPAFVELLMRHESRLIKLNRGMRPATKELIIDSGTAIRKDADIKTELESLLGASAKVLDDYIFVAQDELKSFISQTDSSRLKTLQILFGMDKAEKCYVDVNDFLPTIRLPMAIDNEDDLRQSIQELSNLINEHKQKLLQFADLPDDWNYNTDPNKRLCDMWQIKVDHAKRMAVESAVLSQLQAELVATNTEHDQLKQQYEDAGSLVAAAQAEYNQLVTLYHNLIDYEGDNLRYKALEKKIADQTKLNAEYAASFRPSMSGIEKICVQPALFYGERGVLASKMEHYGLFIATFSQPQHSVTSEAFSNCPTCLQPVVNKDEQLVRYRELHTVVSQEWREIDQLIRMYEKYKSDLAAFEANCADNTTAMATLKGNFSAYDSCVPTSPCPERTAAELLKSINEFAGTLSAAKHECEAIGASFVTAINRVFSVTARLQSQTKRLADMEVERKQYPNITETMAKEASAKITQQIQRFEQKGALKALMSSLTTQLADVSARTSKLQESKRTAAKLDNYRGLLLEAKDVLHRDKLPRILSQSYLELLTDDINITLAMLDSAYRVEPVEGVDFRAIFKDGRDVPISRLSGGEKTIFAIAFRLVVNSTFAKEVGMLCLDEPTAGLPTNDVESLETAFDRLRELSHLRRLQVIMISHERGLARLFDNVIELPSVQL